ncbi:unnamed protein product [Arabidopsis arenosa]|uniref:Pectate lyase n=1 Tax=Arabidopsis arenosa TaxID=38785 RepID=A0A8S2B527_ARAAE|nr:unnamed protein product [Arabidopsis arenosa]
MSLVCTIFLFLLNVSSAFAFVVPKPPIVRQLSTSLTSNSTASCSANGNPIDDCWRCDENWKDNRKNLADCAVGFGRDAIGGRAGEFYTVTDSGDDNPLNPSPGTLRYAATQDQPLWIIFDRDMVIQLKQDLQVASYKTIDGRGNNVQIAYGPCLTLYKVSNVIINNLYIHDCVPAKRNALSSLGGYSDGDGISIFESRDIWIDHCTLEKCYDGLIDAVNGSTDITISNTYMLNHNEVMLLGHSDEYSGDRDMRVTIAFNYFGEGLVQRMPRCRHGYFHIVNNIYREWKMYAIGGSANPTIFSQGNVFIASNNQFTKEVTKRESADGDEEWKEWNWKSEGDEMVNGAFFTPSGKEDSPSYAKFSSMVARPASLLKTTHPSVGVLSCEIDQAC